MRTPRAPRRAVVSVVLALLAATGACAAGPDAEDAAAADPHAVLLARPSFEDMVARYRRMQDRIRSGLDAALGPHAWRDVNGGTPGTCLRPFQKEDDGQSASLPLYGFAGGIPDDRWPQAARIVETVIGEYGFDTAGLLRIDEPGRHEINAHDRVLDAYFVVGTGVNTSMQTTTGCHLPAARRPPP